MSFMSVVFCQVEVSCVERSPTECGVSECDREASITRRPLHTRGFAAWGWGVGGKRVKNFVPCISVL
jgi:hypothetical protein